MTPKTDSNATTSENSIVRTVRACAMAIFAIALIVAAVSVSGVLPESLRTFMLIGAASAVLTGTCGACILARSATVTHQDPNEVARAYMLGLSLNLAMQAIPVFLGILAIYFAGEKFPALATFGFSFATAAVLLQIVSAVSISRFLRARARAADAATVSQDGTSPLTR